MPVAYVGAAAAAASLGSTIAGAVGGNTPTSTGQSTSTSNAFQLPPADQSQAINSFMHMYGGSQPFFDQLAGASFPGLFNASAAQQNNPYAGLAQQGANWASGLATGMPVPGAGGMMGGASGGGMGMGGGPMAGLPQQGMGMPGGVAGMQFGGANQLFNAGGQILNQGFDPQQALYNRTQQQLMDQINAANAASGVSGPAAAGVAQQGLTNFNIDWQNNLLNRMLAGERGAGQAFAGASDLGGLGIGTLTSGSALPYATYNSQQQNIINAINQLTGGAQNYGAAAQTQGNPWLQALGLAGPTSFSSSNTAFNPFGQQQAAGQGLASALTNPSLQSGINQLFAPANFTPNTTATDFGALGADQFGAGGSTLF